jgi:hypothetical protein
MINRLISSIRDDRGLKGNVFKISVWQLGKNTHVSNGTGATLTFTLNIGHENLISNRFAA